MKLSAEQFQEQLVDYLYGELHGEQLAAFEASLAASEEQRRELAALEQTLGVVRRGLKGPLSEEPPMHVRTAILAAAASELSLRRSSSAEQATAERGSQAPAQPSKLRALVRKVGRHPVLYPALGIAAVFALVVLGKRVEHERYASESPESFSPSERDELARNAARGEAREEAKAEQPSDPTTQFAQPPPTAPDDYAEQAPAQVDLLRRRGSGGVSSESARKKGRAGGGSSSPGGLGSLGAQREQAGPRSASAPRSAASAEAESREGFARAPRAPERDDESGSDALGGAGAAAAEAKSETGGPRRASSAAPVVSADKSAQEVQAEPSFAAPPPARAPAKPAAKRAAEAADSVASGEGVDELARRAQAHAAAGRFREASVAYRALLARFPQDERAAIWRKELARAQQAAQAEDAR